MRQSHLFTKTRKDVSSQEHSVNATLLERGGYVSKLMAGVYSYLPLGYRVLSRIEDIVRRSMQELGAEELLLPALHPKEPWVTTGRWETLDVLYRISARDKEYCLGPTHEEVITPLARSYISSYKDLPRAVFQIQTKYRNEARPKSGVLRGREFRMKDLYSFHTTEEDLTTYYDRVKDMYIRIFERCGLGDRTYLTYAAGGTFSKHSHEYQTVTPYGEDIIFVCEPCKVAVNKEIIKEQATCPQCDSSTLTEHKAIEVGNIFKLRTAFSEPLNLTFQDKDDTAHTVLMGCYGIGTSRLMGAIVEALHDDAGIIWPAEVAPYDVHLLSLARSDEAGAQAEKLYHDLQQQGYEVLFDDRATRPGTKFADADLIGIPTRLVVSDKTVEQGSVEAKQRGVDAASMLAYDELPGYLQEHIKR